MATQAVKVTAGTTSAVMAVTNNDSVFVGPQVLGGTMLLEWAASQNGPWNTANSGALGQGQSWRLSNGTTSAYVRATAATQAGTMAISTITGPGQIVQCSLPCASLSSTAEQVLFSFRIPPLVLPLNFSIRVNGFYDFTNAANAKTLQCRINGIAGTLFFQGADWQSLLNANIQAACAGLGDGVSWFGYGAGDTDAAGLGASSTAYTTLSRDYISQETEIVITCTKTGSAGEAFVQRGLVVILY